MSADVFTLKLNSAKTVSALKNFIVSIENDPNLFANTCGKTNYHTTALQKTVASKMLNCDQTILTTDKNQIKRILALNGYLERKAFMSKCETIKRIVLLLMILSIVSAVVFIFTRKVIDIYLFCFIIWTLSCFSLWVTLKVIIKEWKR